MAKKVALGKGIASLIGNNEQAIQTAKERMIEPSMPPQIQVQVEKEIVHSPLMVNVHDIKTNPHQPRKIFKEKYLQELAASIQENGIIQPLIVVKSEDGGFELVAGERRLRAAKIAQIEQVPVVVKRATEKDRMVMSIIENVQRSDLNCVEEALAYFQLMDDFKLTQEEVAKKLGKERSSVANFLRLLKLPRAVIELLQEEKLSFGHGKLLAAVKDRDQCIFVANKAAEDQLTIKETEALINYVPKKEKIGLAEGDFFRGKADQYRQKLEQKTGFHFGIKTDAKGKGQFSIKFANEAEFNDIYEYLLGR